MNMNQDSQVNVVISFYIISDHSIFTMTFLTDILRL